MFIQAPQTSHFLASQHAEAGGLKENRYLNRKPFDDSVLLRNVIDESLRRVLVGRSALSTGQLQDG